MKVGVIGGTGFYELLDWSDETKAGTEFGDVVVYRADFEGREVHFLPRHGTDHDRLAYEVNYRGNMLALKNLGVERVFATCAVGSLNPDIPVGHFALLDQFVDVTTNRVGTYGKYSVDLTDPYCPDLRAGFLIAAEELDTPITPQATYICVDGPRYETGAEIQLYRSWGMDVVGMTSATEAALARELGLCYAVVTISTDLAAGIGDVPPDLETHRNVVRANKERMSQLLLKAISTVSEKKSCGCLQAYERAVQARSEQLGKPIKHP